MKRIHKTFIFALLALTIVGCSSGGSGSKKSRGVDPAIRQSELANEGDSLAYIVGMNVAEQLLKMDSTINISVVCRAIIEQSEEKAVMSREVAREEYMRYLLYVEPERRRRYEERFLADLASNDRNFTRTKSGLTYHISVIGDESRMAKGAGDWVSIRYTISRIGGEQIVTDREESESLTDLLGGLEESVRLIGKGGKIEAWMPSQLAYGEDGDEELGIEAIETLHYQIELVDVEKGKASEYKQKRREENF